MGDSSLYQQPANPAELKVYAGGALPDLVGGAVSPGQVSLLQTPAESVKMIEYRGGARKETGGRGGDIDPKTGAVNPPSRLPGAAAPLLASAQQAPENNDNLSLSLSLSNSENTRNSLNSQNSLLEGLEGLEEEEGKSPAPLLGEQPQAKPVGKPANEGSSGQTSPAPLAGKPPTPKPESKQQEEEESKEQEEEESKEQEEEEEGLDPKKIKFRGVSLKDIENDEMYSQASKFILKFVKTVDELDKEEKVGEVSVLPVVLYKDGSGNNIKVVTTNNNFMEFFIYGVKGGELTSKTQEDLFKILDYEALVLFTSKNLKKDKESPFLIQKNRTEIKEEFIIKDFLKYFSGDQNEKYELIKLANDFFVREIPLNSEKESSYKKDILSFKFVADEELLFNKVLKFNNPYIKEYIESQPEEFYTFWKTFIKYDATDEFRFTTKKEELLIRNYLKTLLILVRGKIQKTALQFLFKTVNPNEVLRRKVEEDRVEEQEIEFQESSLEQKEKLVDISGATSIASSTDSSSTPVSTADTPAPSTATPIKLRPKRKDTLKREIKLETKPRIQTRSQTAKQIKKSRDKEEEEEEEIENNNSSDNSTVTEEFQDLLDYMYEEWHSYPKKTLKAKGVLEYLLEIPIDDDRNEDLAFTLDYNPNKSFLDQFPKIENVSSDPTIKAKNSFEGKTVQSVLLFLFRINWNNIYKDKDLTEQKKEDITDFFFTFFRDPVKKEDIKNYLFPSSVAVAAPGIAAPSTEVKPPTPPPAAQAPSTEVKPPTPPPAAQAPSTEVKPPTPPAAQAPSTSTTIPSLSSPAPNTTPSVPSPSSVATPDASSGIPSTSDSAPSTSESVQKRRSSRLQFQEKKQAPQAAQEKKGGSRKITRRTKKIKKVKSSSVLSRFQTSRKARSK